jgi:hypothetical protein
MVNYKNEIKLLAERHWCSISDTSLSFKIFMKELSLLNFFFLIVIHRDLIMIKQF